MSTRCLSVIVSSPKAGHTHIASLHFKQPLVQWAGGKWSPADQLCHICCLPPGGAQSETHWGWQQLFSAKSPSSAQCSCSWLSCADPHFCPNGGTMMETQVAVRTIVSIAVTKMWSCFFLLKLLQVLLGDKAEANANVFTSLITAPQYT